MPFTIFVDGSSNLPGSVTGSLDIRVLPCSYTVDGRPSTYNGQLDSFDPQEYYEALRQGAKVQTSLLNTQLILDSFRPELEQGRDPRFQPGQVFPRPVPQGSPQAAPPERACCPSVRGSSLQRPPEWQYIYRCTPRRVHRI